MFLLERWQGVWVPLSPPVSGVYNRYGRIELWPQHRTAHERWVEREVDRVIERETLHSSDAFFADALEEGRAEQKSEAGRPQGTPVPAFLHVAAEVVFNGIKLQFEGREVQPAIHLDPVAEAVTSPAALPRDAAEEAFFDRLSRRTAPTDDPDLESEYAAWLLAHERPRHAAYLRALAHRRQNGFLVSPPAESVPVLVQLHRVMRWAESRGGLVPIRSQDAGQHGDAERRRFAHDAWKKGDPAIQRLLEQRCPDWTRRWQTDDRTRAAREALEAPVPAGTPSIPYTPTQRFHVGDVLAHKTFGLGRVEESEADKLRVRFGAEVKVLKQARS